MEADYQRLQAIVNTSALFSESRHALGRNNAAATLDEGFQYIRSLVDVEERSKRLDERDAAITLREQGADELSSKLDERSTTLDELSTKLDERLPSSRNVLTSLTTVLPLLLSGRGSPYRVELGLIPSGRDSGNGTWTFTRPSWTPSESRSISPRKRNA